MSSQAADRPARRRLTVDDVVRAAAAETEASGLEALTMRAVAQRLGASPMALYRHVADRDELVGMVVDRTLAGVELPPVPPGAEPEQVAEWLRAMCRAVRVRLLAYPGSAEHLLLHGPTGPHTLMFMGAVCSVLRRTGRSAQQVAWAYDWLMSTAAAYISKESRLARGERSGTGIAEALAARAGTLRLPADLLEVIGSFTGDMASAYERATGGVIASLVAADGQP